MKRILLLSTDLEIGGTPTVVRELAIRLSAAGGAEIEVACLSTWGPTADQIAKAGISVTAFDASNALQLIPTARRLARLMRERKIDVVFSFLVHANAVAALAASMCRGVRLLQSIQTTQPKPRWHWKVQAFAQQGAERVIVPSPSVADAAREWAKIPAGKIDVIPNAIDVSAFDRLRGESAARSEITRIGFLGRLDPIKRIPDLIEAMQFLEPPLHLHIFGEGPERGRLEQLIGRLGLAQRATLHGAVGSPQEALRQMDLLVLPSAAEGFGLVLIEAMAAGIPVVASDVAGIRDVVKHEETGLLVPVAAPERIAGAIRRLATDAPLRQRLSGAAWIDVQRRFSWESVLPLYRRALATIS